MFKRRQKKQANESVSLDQVKTLIHENSHSQDRNRDGIPDYLQRPELASIISSNKDLNQADIDVEKEIEEWIMGLRGYEFQVESNSYIPRSPPTMNETGITAIKTHLKSVVHKHAINTSLTLDDAHIMCKDHTIAFIKQLRDNRKIYQVGLSDLTPIVTQLDHFVFLVLSRAVNDAQRDHITKRTKLTGDVTKNSPAL